MPHFNPLIDFPLILLAFVATLARTLYWVFRTDQDKVPRNEATVRRAAFRLAVVAISLGSLCYLAGIAFWFFAIVAVVLMLSTQAGFIGIAGLPLIALYLLSIEYVLGFPELFLTPRIRETESSLSTDVHRMVGREAITKGPLRPQGNIVIDEQSFPASSASGKMIDSGVWVSVTGARNGNLLVVEPEDDG